jgi:regulator of CtrA degradation
VLSPWPADKGVNLCHLAVMRNVATLDPGLHRRLVDGLYLEAMMMADEARAYFDGDPLGRGETVDPLRRVSFACESLKVTTRLMHVIAWLLSQRAWQRGEISDADLVDEKYRLGRASLTDPTLTEGFPFEARALIEGSQDLYDRVARLEDRLGHMNDDPKAQDAGPARALLDRLNTAF